MCGIEILVGAAVLRKVKCLCVGNTQGQECDVHEC